MREGLLSDSLMIKLEGTSIENFNPDAAINHWFNIIARRPGGGQWKDNVKESKEVAAQHEAEAGDLEGKVEDEVEMIQDVEAAANDGNIEYELVEGADDANYQSDYDSEDDDTNDVFNKIAEY